MCLAQGHNAVTPVRLEYEALQSRVKHSIAEPLRSLDSSKRLLQDCMGRCRASYANVIEPISYELAHLFYYIYIFKASLLDFCNRS